MRILQYNIFYAIEMCLLISYLILTQLVLTMNLSGDLCCITDLCYMAYCITGKNCSTKFRDFALEQTFCSINFGICVLVICVCIVIFTNLQDKLSWIRSNREKHEI